MAKYRGIAIFICVLLVSNIFAQDVLEVKKQKEVFRFSEYIQFYEDSSGRLSLDEVREKNEFSKAELEVPNLGISNSVFWAKFKIKNLTGEKLILELANPLIDNVSLFVVSDKGITNEIAMGETVGFHERKYNHQNYLFDIAADSSEYSYWLRLQSSDQVQLPLSIGTYETIMYKLGNKDMIFSIYFGVMIVMLLYNLFIYFTVKDKSYLFYVIYILFVTLTQATFQGYSFRFLWPESTWLAVNGVHFTSVFVGIASIIFLREFAQTRRFVPKMDKALLLFLPLYGVGLILTISGMKAEAFKLLQLIVTVLSIYMLVVAFQVRKKGYRPGSFFLLAWSIFLIGVFIFTFKDFGLLPYNNVTYYTMPVGSAIETVLLSFGLADRINILKKEKEASQKAALNALMDKERLVRGQNVLLEQKVQNRTLELSQANQDLNKVIEELKTAQSQLVNAEKMASLGQLTAGVAHEINNPINFVKSNVTPLRRDIDDMLEVITKYGEIKSDTDIQAKLDEIEKRKRELDMDYLVKEVYMLLDGIGEGAERTANIVTSLRTFSRLDQQDLDRFDLKEGIESTLTLLQNESKEIEIIRAYGENIPEVECYPGKINQVIMNLLSNAIYALKESPKNSKEITISTRKEEGFVVLSIGDNALGIPEDIQEKIFEPFFTTKDVGEGTGMGLSIVFGIIKEHKGKISVKSEVGVGSTFTLQLPIKS